MALAHALIIAEQVEQRFPRGVDVPRRDVVQLVPGEYDVVAVHQQVILRADAGHIQLLERSAFPAALLERLEPPALIGP